MWPPDIGKLPPILDKPLKQIIERVNQITPINGRGIRIEQGVGGRSINARTADGSGSSSGANNSLVIYDAGEGLLGVTLGTVNGIIPNKMYAGDEEPKTMRAPEEGYIFASAVFDARRWRWTGSDVIVESSRTKVSTATTAYKLIGTCSKVGDTLRITQELYGPVTIPACDLNF